MRGDDAKPNKSALAQGNKEAFADDIQAFWAGELPQEKLDFCLDWLRKRGVYAARIFFGFSVLFHVLAPLLVWIWFDPRDLMVEKMYLLHGLGLVYSLTLVLSFDRGLRRPGIIYGALQIYLNAGSVLIIAFEVLYGRPEIHVLQAYMVSTAISFVSLITSPYSRSWMTGIVFIQNVVLMLAAAYFDKAAGLSIALWYIFFSGMGWLLQTRLVVKSIREALQEFESRKILARLARVHLDQELSLARHIEESFLPPAKLEIGFYSVECYRYKSAHLGGHWFALRSDGADGLYALMCETSDLGIHGAMILHAVQSLWAEDLGNSTLDPEAWLHKTNRALFVLGKSEIHELEVSLVHVSGSRMTYWGGGDRVLFQVAEDQLDLPVLRPLARGSVILGRSEHIFPTATTVALHQRDRIFLGNRSLFPDSDRYEAKDVLRLHLEMRVLAEVATNREGEEIGRSLVVISRRPTSGRVLHLKQA